MCSSRSHTAIRELRALDMSSNSLTSDGAVKVTRALHSLSHIQRLQLYDNAICDNAEELGRALALLPSLRHTDLSYNLDMSLAACCNVFAPIISSKAPIETLMLPSNLLSEFPSLFSRFRLLPAIQNSNECWCGSSAIAQAAWNCLIVFLQVGVIQRPDEASAAFAS